jgi:hypothetical protein
VPVQVDPVAEATPTPDALRTDLNAIEAARKPSDKPMTEEEVKKAWNPTLTFWAFVDVFVAVLGGAILSAIWQWDRNGNGIDDAKEASGESAVQAPQLSPDIVAQIIQAVGYAQKALPPSSPQVKGMAPPAKAEKPRD